MTVTIFESCLENVLSNTCTNINRIHTEEGIGPYQCKHTALPSNLICSSGDLFCVTFPMPVHIEQSSSMHFFDTVSVILALLRGWLWSPGARRSLRGVRLQGCLTVLARMFEYTKIPVAKKSDTPWNGQPHVGSVVRSAHSDFLWGLILHDIV